eukprot:5686527-Amphidinium_carterae.1
MADSGRYGTCLVRGMKLIKCFGELMECPKKWLAWHRATIDAGYKGTADAPSSEITFFCCDTLIHIFNLPSAFSGKFAGLKDLPAKERQKKIREWVEENNYHVTDPAKLKMDEQTNEQLVMRGQDSASEVKLAEAVDAYNDDETASNVSSWTTVTRPSIAAMGMTWEHEFY